MNAVKSMVVLQRRVNAVNCVDNLEEYNTHKVIIMETIRYDDETEEIPNETTLHAMAEAKKIVEAWKKLKECDNHGNSTL